jgi:quercetin dioxygenase-like cupin family protein
MRSYVASAALLTASCLGVGSQALAQELPRSFVASPDIYKVIAQNDQYKVIAVTWKPGQKDIVHSHPASAVYYLTDCSLRIYAQDGTSREAQPRAGAAIVQRPIPGHVLENVGSADCRLIMFEPS